MALESMDVLCNKYEHIIDEIQALTTNCEPDEEAGAHEKAAVLLSEFADSIADGLQERNDKDRSFLEEMIARLKCQEGLQYLALGNLEKGKPPLLEGAKRLEQNSRRNLLLLQTAYNNLGVGALDHQDDVEALEYFLKAESLYKNQQLGGSPRTPDGVKAAAALQELGATHSAAELAKTDNGKVEEGDAALKESEEDACDALYQLSLGTPSIPPPAEAGDPRETSNGVDKPILDEDKDYVRQYATTLVQLAEVYHRQGREELGAEYITKGLSLHAALGIQNPEEMEKWVMDMARLAGYFAHSNVFGIAHYILRAADVTVQRAAESGMAVDVETRPNLNVAWAQLYLQQLLVSRLVLSEKQVNLQESLTAVPDKYKFPGVSEEGLPWGKAAVAEEPEQAVPLFNNGMRHCRSALQVLTLESFLPQHCEVVLIISELYKNLAACEKETHNKCVLEKQRAKRVETLLEPLTAAKSPRYLGLYRAVQAEVADAYRNLAENKHNEGRPFLKVVAPANEAKKHLEAFLETFKVNGQLPKKVEGDIEAAAFLDAVFHLSWVLYRMQPPSKYRNGRDSSFLDQAVAGYDYLIKYVDRNGEPRAPCTAITSLPMCQEMRGLLKERANAIKKGVLLD
eukprot:jgi/Botrbrau1/1050/Bobra.0076s0017.1